MSPELQDVLAKIERRKAGIARLDRLLALDRGELVATIRAADRLFFDGKPGGALALIRDTRQDIDATERAAA